MGRTRDPKTGVVRPQAFMPYRINGQYIIEGLAAGLMFCVGAGGFILLDVAIAKSTRLPRVRCRAACRSSLPPSVCGVRTVEGGGDDDSTWAIVSEHLLAAI